MDRSEKRPHVATGNTLNKPRGKRTMKLLLLMRSTWRIETVVLPELSRTMAYTTRNTVNRLNESNLNPVVLERSKEE